MLNKTSERIGRRIISIFPMFLHKTSFAKNKSVFFKVFLKTSYEIILVYRRRVSNHIFINIILKELS
jgi:hypothetical protein